MSNKLFIVEAPKKLKTISKILGKDFTVRATGGHIIDLAKGKNGDIGVDIKNGFKPRYEVLADSKDKIKSILDAARSCDEIFVASDPDREGEAIAFHVKSQLDKFNIPIHRVKFQELTKSAILNAINSPIGFDDDLYDAQQARRVLDRIVGFMVSPYLSKKLGDKLSAGRVQSVALRIVVDREKEIEAFKSETFFNISVDLKKDSVFNAKYPGRVKEESLAKEIEEKLKISTYKITSIQASKSTRAPNPPLTTSKLQQEASAKFKFSADRTMKAAQALYEAGQVTYIRSDSLRSAPEAIQAARDYLTSLGKEVPDSPNTYKNKDASQDAHEAIRPTDVKTEPDSLILEPDQQKIYELIWRLFLASQMKPAEYDNVNATVHASEGYDLIAKGKILKYNGWLDIAGPFVKKEKDIVLPILLKGDIPDLKKVISDKKNTTPPSRYNDGTLVRELEDRGIGRPSTYASTIQRITNRKYITKSSKGFVPTNVGREVVEDLEKHFSFMEYKYTANMEKELDKIAEGKMNYKDMMSKFFDGFKVEFQEARGSQGKSTDIPCPNCGADTVVRKSKYGYFAGCVKYPECKGIVGINLVDGKAVKKGEQKNIDDSVKCPKCGSGMVLREDGKFGPFYSCSEYPKCDGKRKVPFGKKCPKCGDELFATLFGDKMKLACMGYPNCRHVEKLPDDAKINWVNPESVTPPVYDRKVEKVLK
jgi:DNA topoisomerase I